MLERLLGRAIDVKHADWRPGDQRIFVADTRKAARDLGWRPRVGKAEGIRRLEEWVTANRSLFVG
jgi:CDP-paratose 2-epimerase